MRHLGSAVLVGLVTAIFVAGVALAQGGGQGKGGQDGARETRCEQRFEAMDTNQDGQVSEGEFLAAPHRRDNPEQMFKEMDVQGRGYLTKEELCTGKGMGMGKGMGRGMGPRQNQ